MLPTIVYIKGEIIREEEFDGGFADANFVAEQAINDGKADRAFVRDAHGNTTAEFPRPAEA